MTDFLTRAQVLLGAVATWLVALSVGLTAAATEIAQAAPEQSETVVAWLLRAAAWLAVAWQVVRQHTPVPPDARGLLPEPDVMAAIPQPEGEDPFWQAGPH
jgi:hypothetical protein